MTLKTKDLLTLGELDRSEFEYLINKALEIKEKRVAVGRQMEGKSLAMIFEKPSTRTRVSFEVGMAQMGGHAVNLAPGQMQLSRGETVQDTAKTLSAYVDCIMARVYDHSVIEDLAKHASVPVINGLSDSYHPCQILADFATIKEKRGKMDGLKIAWIGDGNNVCNSMIYGCSLAGSDIHIATPPGHEPDKDAVEKCKDHVTLTNDPKEAAAGADVVVTDTFVSIHDKDKDRAGTFLPRYQVTEELMGLAGPDSVFLHCLPAKRGAEVTSGVIDGPRSAVWQEAENRLHTQKALLTEMVPV